MVAIPAFLIPVFKKELEEALAWAERLPSSVEHQRGAIETIDPEGIYTHHESDIGGSYHVQWEVVALTPKQVRVLTLFSSGHVMRKATLDRARIEADGEVWHRPTRTFFYKGSTLRRGLQTDLADTLDASERNRRRIVELRALLGAETTAIDWRLFGF